MSFSPTSEPQRIIPVGNVVANGHDMAISMAMSSASPAVQLSQAASGACTFKGDFKPRAFAWAGID
jgi:hypothetical protein